jgi:hypothetical protein
VLVTSTFNKTADDVRALLCYQTVKNARECGYDILVVDGSPCEEFRSELSHLGAMLVDEDTKGMTMGAARRQAVREGSSFAGPDGAWFWLEPEKCTIVELMKPAFDLVLEDKADLVLVRRESLESYPLFQQYSEAVGNIGWAMATGKAYDMFCGVRGGNAKVVPYFMKYDPKAAEAKDQWDALHLPVMDIMVSDLRVEEVTVPYVHPQEQTKAESGPDFLRKRAVQLSALVETQFAYAKRCGLFQG